MSYSQTLVLLRSASRTWRTERWNVLRTKNHRRVSFILKSSITIIITYEKFYLVIESFWRTKVLVYLVYEKQVEISRYKLNYGFKTFLNYTISSIHAMLKKLIKIKLPRTFYISSRWKNFQRFSLTLNWINIRRHLSERIPNLSNLSNEQLHVHEISKYQVVAV